MESIFSNSTLNHITLILSPEISRIFNPLFYISIQIFKYNSRFDVVIVKKVCINTHNEEIQLITMLFAKWSWGLSSTTIFSFRTSLTIIIVGWDLRERERKKYYQWFLQMKTHVPIIHNANVDVTKSDFAFLQFLIDNGFLPRLFGSLHLFMLKNDSLVQLVLFRSSNWEFHFEILKFRLQRYYLFLKIGDLNIHDDEFSITQTNL